MLYYVNLTCSKSNIVTLLVYNSFLIILIFLVIFFCCFFFFFQAEDGIRDLTVTGVQTCALPISFFHTFPLSRPFSVVFFKFLICLTLHIIFSLKLSIFFTPFIIQIFKGLLVSSKIGRASCRERV